MAKEAVYPIRIIDAKCLLGDIIFHYLILEIFKPTEIVDYLLIERGRV
jgi:hypothetical protein